MKKFRCIVTRTDEYIVEIDEKLINEEWMAAYREDFTNIHSLKDHAENIAWNRSANGEGVTYEGYGFVFVNGEAPWGAREELVEKGINIKVIEEENYEFDVEEIK